MNFHSITEIRKQNFGITGIDMLGNTGSLLPASREMEHALPARDVYDFSSDSTDFLSDAG